MSEEAYVASLEKVDHVVVLMMENRSFDHMLGYLSLTGGRTTSTASVPGSGIRIRDAPIRLITSLRRQWTWTRTTPPALSTSRSAAAGWTVRCEYGGDPC